MSLKLFSVYTLLSKKFAFIPFEVFEEIMSASFKHVSQWRDNFIKEDVN